MTTDDLSTARWRKSSFSQPTGSCVELATDAGGRGAVRDSKNPEGPVLPIDVHPLVRAIKNCAVRPPFGNPAMRTR